MIDPDKPNETFDNFSFAWGLFDVKDQCWLGDDTGPKLFRDTTINGIKASGQQLARGAATVVNQMFDSGHRFRARLYTGGPMRIKDTIQARYDGAEALRRICGPDKPD
jgi:hypothetical protein